jgi:hypothetical protein
MQNAERQNHEEIVDNNDRHGAGGGGEKKAPDRYTLAEESLREAATNAVPGIRLILITDFDCASGRLMDWHAHAKVDFVNRLGGVERTNLYFGFTTTPGKGPEMPLAFVLPGYLDKR